MTAPVPTAGPLVGVLLAAGRSRRMGRTKQLLPWPGPDGERPLVAAAFDAIAPACIAMIVVLGHEAEAIAAALAPRTFRRAESDPDAPMYESVRAGLTAARDLEAGAAVLLHPADHPAVRPSTLRALRAAYERDPKRAVIPQHHGKGGHPVLIPPGFVPALIAWDGAGGLRRWRRDHPQSARRLDVEDPGVTRDLDRPEDYGGAASPGGD